MFYWWGSDKGTYKATGTTWEESDGDIKSVLKHIHVERGGGAEVCFGDCEALLWVLGLTIFQRGSKVLIF